MKIRDELNRELDFSCDELIEMLREIKGLKEQEVDVLKQKIKGYEDKRRAEEAFYQSLSPVRKFFAGRAPSHHQAVEYMVHVKERLKQIDGIKQRIVQIDRVLSICGGDASEETVEVASGITDDIIQYRKGQGE
ncbi:hypothetical protein LCM10_08230 [Rossellomorea aquimaris]|uniref:hypothetical protein n=1 Tax=Rossellomorea aquimaris TaxID=189382 RepID=UPI001CD5E62A|nr:hypothetical protein [Rossellomorea aquimaris]MCA1054969.1 hypothetical protein [Rossellomorea aquimaris]